MLIPQSLDHALSTRERAIAKAMERIKLAIKELKSQEPAKPTRQELNERIKTAKEFLHFCTGKPVEAGAQRKLDEELAAKAQHLAAEKQLSAAIQAQRKLRKDLQTELKGIAVLKAVYAGITLERPLSRMEERRLAREKAQHEHREAKPQRIANRRQAAAERREADKRKAGQAAPPPQEAAILLPAPPVYDYSEPLVALTETFRRSRAQ